MDYYVDVQSRGNSIHDLLLVIAEEHLNRQPSVTANLEAVWQRAELLHLVVRQTPAVELVVALDT